MNRFVSFVVFVVVALLLAGLFASPLRAQSGRGLKIGEEFKGELPDAKEKPYIQYKRGDGFASGNYFNGNINAWTEMPVNLKAGQDIKIVATVIGKTRKVGITILDPTRKPLDGKHYEAKSNQLLVEEVPATGIYTIVVYSDSIGPFSVRAIDPNVKDTGDVKALEARIEQLEKELTEARSKLKELRRGLDTPIRK